MESILANYKSNFYYNEGIKKDKRLLQSMYKNDLEFRIYVDTVNNKELIYELYIFMPISDKYSSWVCLGIHKNKRKCLNELKQTLAELALL